MKVRALTGATLDYWVAKAEGIDPSLPHMNGPSTNWAQGGPIIERERIDIEHCADDSCLAIHSGNFDRGDFGFEGPTPLVAAMRAYVASKFGLEVPDEVSGA